MQLYSTSVLLILGIIHLQYENIVLGQYVKERSRPSAKERGPVHPCEQSSCYPATGNLLIGREKQLKASSTCGLEKEEQYCIVSHLEESIKCFRCDSRPPTMTMNRLHLNHQISNIVYQNYRRTGPKSWWQSENGKENVTIELTLEAEFHFTHLIIVFKTFRPAAMLIERSYDFGRTWNVYRYFAHNCSGSFPHIPDRRPLNLSDVVCEHRYSQVTPLSNGEVIYRVLPSHIPIDNPYSPVVQNLLKMTNLRINFTKLHTLGDDLLDNRQEIQEKYYYAISNMIVRGSCSCYGHASRCLPLSGVEAQEDMVHGRCECTHNTKGRNCEQCEDFFNDLPWKPAFGKHTNACKRCNCHNHANSCHFDAAVFDQSGKVSGGVCDGCQHNTMGTNCEMCKPYFYHDPERDIQDPEACKPCDCDPIGSLDSGICDSQSDDYNKQEAGKCHCKENVDGRRCDICKNGFWNFTEENPSGCQSCTCNTLGTIDNHGCNVYSGECTCKRYVTGRDCNQCLPEYWGLSEKRDGCQPCDCDPGGSLDNSCDVITGQCLCREHVQGRTCSQPKQYHFAPVIDFFVYEAELASSSDNCQVVIREPYQDRRENSWTGTGFIRAFENSKLEFIIDNIQTTMDYDTVIRYEPQLPGHWDEVIVRVIRPEPLDVNGPCANSRPEDDIKRARLIQGSRDVAVFPPTCLESNKTYKIIIEFKRYSAETDTPNASILIDSIVLIPRVESIPWFRGSPSAENSRQEYERYRCSQYYYSVNHGPIPDICKKHHASIGFYVYNGAHACHCNTTGSTSNICNEFGGTCPCKHKVVGRKCDRCAPGHYGFGPEGCKPCNCNSIGALDNFCDVPTGQCKCRSNMYGRKCDQCQPGYWNFPNCQPCQCNGHADICDSRTGACISCRDATAGHDCERCIDGYYGDPRFGVDIPCRPCPCPGTVGSGHSYADRCTLDPHTKDVICECQEGYAGSRCDVCADNYYGHPEIPGGSCRPCNCSKNVDITHPGNCDPHTGQCRKCLFNTEGDHCEWCKVNYYGDAIHQNCIECGCNILGTNSSKGPCNRITGQCPCHNNVIGLKCDQCRENHWKIASGQGCEACDCDPIGAVDTQCNSYEGQCECRQGFGGRQCNQCQANFWGNPNSKCHACDCDPMGSEKSQCHRENGTCICRTGMGGDKCNMCARGFLGTAPYCSPCGECFTNWDLILNNLKDETLRLIEEAKKIKKVGTAGAYTGEFKAMEYNLTEIRNILNNATVSSQDLQQIESQLSLLHKDLQKTTSYVQGVESKLNNATNEIILAKVSLEDLQKQSENLKKHATQLKDDATSLQEANVDEAFRITQNAQRMAQDALQTAKDSKVTIQKAERQRIAAESIVTRATFTDNNETNNEHLNLLQDELNDFRSNISFLNEHMCGRPTDSCDLLCGGAGCEFCGGVSCDKGAKDKVKKAFAHAQEASSEIKVKEVKAQELLRTLSQVHVETRDAHNSSAEAHRNALKLLNYSSVILQETEATIKDLHDSLNSSGGSPDDIKHLAEQTLDKNIHLKPKQITELAQKINHTVTALTDIDKILQETANDLNRTNKIERDANETKENAEDILGTANRVLKALKEAQEAQEKAREAINKANVDINTTETDLKEIVSETKQAQSTSHYTVGLVESFRNRLKSLKTNFLKNNHGAKEVELKAANVTAKAESTRDKTDDLQLKYSETNSSLAKKAEHSLEIRDRANVLLLKASKLTVSINNKMFSLNSLSNESTSHKQRLEELAKIMKECNDQMGNYLDNIRNKSTHYRNCT